MYNVLITTALSESSAATAVVQCDTEAEADSIVRHINENRSLQVGSIYQTVVRKAERLN